MNSVAKALIILIGINGCASKIKPSGVDLNSNDFEAKIITFYKDIKSSDYRESLYSSDKKHDRFINLEKLYSKYNFSYELYQKYIYSLTPDISYEDYSNQLRSKINKLSPELRSKKFLPAKISRKVKVKDVVGKVRKSRFYFRKEIMSKFYSMINTDSDLTEMKIEFHEAGGEKDKHLKKVIAYLYKSKNGEEFFIDPQILVSTNF